jgi:hypothetical protein
MRERYNEKRHTLCEPVHRWCDFYIFWFFVLRPVKVASAARRQIKRRRRAGKPDAEGDRTWFSETNDQACAFLAAR